ncbi:MAG: hypothetical protein CM1200mP29_15100 [Verrucomicrobiota bacterium]|nr:MAG: hypothetical protein CM1200mP29_15100 [Verrucomicrobiota bacterium]
MSIEAKPITPLGQHEYGGEPFPLVLNVPAKSLGEACEWAGEHAAELDAQAAAHGAVLLRELPLAKPGDFDAVVSAFDYPNFSYDDSLSNAYRINFTPRVFFRQRGAGGYHHFFCTTNWRKRQFFPGKLFFFLPNSARRGRRYADLPLRCPVGAPA